MFDLVPMGWRMMGKLAEWVRRCMAGGTATMLALGVLSGCQPVFLGKEVYEQAYSPSNMLPAKNLEHDPTPLAGPVSPHTPAPPNVLDPDREALPVTLQEAIAKALENGLASGSTVEGRAATDLARFTGPGSLTNQTDRIRVLALNPAISSAAMEASLARFDAVWVTGMNWTNTDNLQQGLSSFNNGHGANFNSSIVKAFANGGVANVSFITNYTNLNAPPAGAFGVLNPQYTPRLNFSYEMPLWRDSGVEINQLLSRLSPITGQIFSGNTLSGVGFNAHQSQVSSFVNGGTEGILVSKLRFDQSRAEFERNVQVLVKNVEIAYWNLYNKYGQLYSFEENLRILRRAYEENYFKKQAGGGGLKPYQFFQSRGQYEEFRANRVQAMQEVLDAERNLRGILGMPMEDGTRLIPITPPQLTELRPDWEQCLQDSLNLRPELILARENLRYHQYLLTIQKNNLKPDLRAFAKYEPVGFGSTLTGDGTFIDGTGTERPTNAFRSLRGLHFADYSLGLYLNVPIGQRAEHAAVRAARLQLAQSYYFVKDQEDKAVIYLTEQYQEVTRWYKQIEAHRNERLAYGEALNSFINLIKAGAENYGKLDFLSIQRSYSAALVKEYNAIAEYNNALARLEWAKGTTLRYNNVHVSEGSLPECAQVNAAQYEKERTRSLVLKQRPDSLAQPGRFIATKESEVTIPEGLPPVNVIEKNEFSKDVVPLFQKTPTASSPLDGKFSPVMGGEPAPEVKGPSLLPTGAPTAPAVDAKPREVTPAFVPAKKEPAPLPKLLRDQDKSNGLPENNLSAKGGALGSVTLEDEPAGTPPNVVIGRQALQPINLSPASQPKETGTQKVVFHPVP